MFVNPDAQYYLCCQIQGLPLSEKNKIYFKITLTAGDD